VASFRVTSAPRMFSGLAVAAGFAVALTACGTPVRSGAQPSPTSAASAPSVVFTLAPVATAAVSQNPAAASIAPPTAAVSTGPEATEVVRLVNVERTKAGCAALTVDPRLTTAAQGHSADMVAKNYFDHTSPDGGTFTARIQATGFPLTQVGENIAAGQPTPAAVMTAWMNSAGHRANILNCSYNQLGVGYAKGGSYGYYWTQDFGKL
jgi:uncharacterized protein YkwD